MINRIIAFFLENRLVTLLLVLFLIFWGLVTIPFSWDTGGLARDPVPVDAIPDIGENQQIVFTEWMGKSPQDIDDQITYPLTTALMGIPGVKTIRSSSVFGFSSIYLVFDEEIEFYWSRARIVEKLNSLPSGLLPDDVQPALGPDATALGQIFWYTLEGRDRDGNPTGGWDPHELRSIQDFYLKYGLSAAQGVSEVASIGGYVQEYQVDIDPVAMKSRNVTVEQIMKAVQTGNRDTGARTIEFNRAEYLVRGLGFIKSVEDLKETVVVSPNNTPVYLRDVAHIQLGPAPRRGGLDKAGTEAVGAVVVARYGANPMEVIGHVKAKIKELEPGLPVKVLADGTYSKVSIVPFYDRTGLINETLGTLEEALSLEILISMIVVILLVMNVRASLLISSLLPLGVLITFIVMRYTGVSANIVALSGIAIAIGVMVDVGIVFTENIIRHLELPQNKRTGPGEKQRIIYEAVTEVSSAVITALATTVISFIPVFALQAQEGKLFQPLAYTKTFALLAALLVGLVVIPAFAYFLYSLPEGKERTRRIMHIGMVILGAAVVFSVPWAGVVLISIGANYLLRHWWPAGWEQVPVYFPVGVLVGTATYFLTRVWLPMGAGYSLLSNFMFVALIVGSILGGLLVVVHYYTRILGWCLANKWLFLSIPLFILFVGLLTWQGINKTLGFVPSMAARIHLNLYQTPVWKGLESAFPGMGKEFMPPLDEGSFLLMPTTMPHSGVEENLETIRMLDQRVMAIPEVELSVGKWGRAASALDPAPISMFENIIQYKSEYLLDPKGHRMRFKVNEAGEFAHKDGSFLPAEEARMYAKPQHLVTDPAGQYLRQWREHIHSPDDIWEEVLAVTQFPGMTSAPKLQPIATRLIMLSTGMRAPMGMKIYGPDLPTIEQVGFQMEKWLQEVPGVRRESVFADRVVGKPYIEIDIDRKAIARYGLSIDELQQNIGASLGGNPLTQTVEGRERYQVRVRYAREFRDRPDQLGNILIPVSHGLQVPLKQLAEIRYVQGPQNIKSENTFLVSYVIFDKVEGFAEVDVVENATALLQQKIDEGSLVIPPGVSYRFAGNYENQVRATQRLAIVIPISLFLILLILYFQFREWQPTLMVFSGVFVAFSGGFILLWLYGQDWFLNFALGQMDMRQLFQVHPVHLSVAVWVGFIALFGVATDDGVVMGTYIQQHFDRHSPAGIADIRETIVQAGQQRVRPAMMTAATTIIALLPVLTSTGKGSDIMVPMAIPTFGGMIIQVMTMFIVPVLYSMWKESQWKKQNNQNVYRHEF